MDLDLRVALLEERMARVEALVGVPRREGVAEGLRAVRPPRDLPASRPDAAAPARLPPVGPAPRRTETVEDSDGSPQGAARGAPRPALAPCAPRAARAVAPGSPKVDLERLLGVAVLGRVGIGAVLLAAAYFAQLAWQSFGPASRVVSIYGLAGVLVGAGFMLRSRVSRSYLAILWGGGAAAAYLAGVVAEMRYGLLGPVPATAALIGAAALGQVLARLSGLQVLAGVALAGAYAAPALVGGPQDARTVLLVYALTLHAWASWTEARWGWRHARGVALAGSIALCALWLLAWGRADASTYLHVHGWLAGLAGPELLAALRGRRLQQPRSYFVSLAAVVVAVGSTLATVPGSDGLRQAYALLAGLSWAAVAALVAWRSGGATPLARALARLAGFLLIAAAFSFWAGRGLSVHGLAQAVVASLAAVALAAVASRRLLGVGEGAALAAAIAVLLPVADQLGWPFGAQDPLLAVAVVPSLLVAFLARSPVQRVFGLALGAGTLALGLLPGHAWWLVLLAAALVALARAARARAVALRDAVLAEAADLVLPLAAVGWAALAFLGGRTPAQPALANPGTVVAAVLLAGLALRRPWRNAPTDARAAAAARVVGGALALLAVLAGWREVTAALEHAAAPGAKALGQAAFLCAAAVAAGATAPRVGGPALRGFALALLGAAVLRGFVGLREAADPARTALLVILPCGAADALARLSPRDDSRARTSTLLALLGAGVLWATLLHSGRLPTGTLVANPRFVAGLVVAIGFALARRRAAAAGSVGAVASRLALMCAVLMAYAVGLFEVFDLVRPLESAQWRSVFVSVYSTLYAAGVLALGFRLRAADLRWAALAGFGAVIVKVGAHDLAAVETPFRILVTGCLGVVLLIAAYAYARRDKAGVRSPGS